jgi:hypothetical protein
MIYMWFSTIKYYNFCFLQLNDDALSLFHMINEISNYIRTSQEHIINTFNIDSLFKHQKLQYLSGFFL